MCRKKHVPAISNLKDLQYKREALHCLNELVTNALTHAEDVLDYLDKLKEPTVFRFSAIPQVWLFGVFLVNDTIVR